MKKSHQKIAGIVFIVVVMAAAVYFSGVAGSLWNFNAEVKSSDCDANGACSYSASTWQFCNDYGGEGNVIIDVSSLCDDTWIDTATSTSNNEVPASDFSFTMTSGYGGTQCQYRLKAVAAQGFKDWCTNGGAGSSGHGGVNVMFTISHGKQCTPDWTCDGWSTCDSGSQTRTCSDGNSCGTDTDKPIEVQSCVATCSPNWECGNWSVCDNRQEARTCSDANGCNVSTGQPDLLRDCEMPQPIVLTQAPATQMAAGGGGGPPAQGNEATVPSGPTGTGVVQSGTTNLPPIFIQAGIIILGLAIALGGYIVIFKPKW